MTIKIYGRKSSCNVQKVLWLCSELKIDIETKDYGGKYGGTKEVFYKALNPKIEIIAPWRIWDLNSREDCINYAKKNKIPLIADGGIRYSGDIAKALAAGADSVMLGGLLAGTDESPGEVELFEGRTYKAYRGMGSIGAMQQGSKDRYFQDGVQKSSKLIPEGIEGRVAYKGTMKTILHQLTGGLKSSMGYVGCKNIEEMKTKTRFIKISSSAKQESHVHDVTIVKEPPNYQPR